MIYPNAKSRVDLNLDEIAIIIWIQGYLHCKKENQNIIEIMMNEGELIPAFRLESLCCPFVKIWTILD